MSDLRKAAQAVLDRWDGPKWDWLDAGPTADLMADLRAALAEESLQRLTDVQQEIEAVLAEREACARIVERNAEVCVHSLTLWDVLNANALAIRARGNTNELI